MTLAEFEERFATADAFRADGAQRRWRDGFVCPCRLPASDRTATRNRLICRSSCYPATVTAGTIFEGTRRPLAMSIHAMWYVAAQGNEASALKLQRGLRLGQFLPA